MKTFCLDTETFYSKELSVTTLGVARYVRETDPYLVSIYGEGFCWVGEPKNAPWEVLRGQQVVAHNAAFDMAVVEELSRRGLAIPEFGDTNCTANLAAYLQAPRNLSGASKELLGISLDKGMRDYMKGRKWGDLDAEKKQAMAHYAALDSKAAWLLWNQHSNKWPDNEQFISQHTMGMTDYGIHVDRGGAEKARNELLKMLHAAEANIPWASELDAKGKPVPVTSPKQIALWCRKFDVPPPTTTDAKSDAFDQWAEQYADRAQFVAAVQQWRSANRLLKVVETLLDRSLEGGRMPYSLKYFGAQHTGRWSGDSGLNCQNFPRKALGGVDVRGLLVPKPGHVFIISDYSAIEPRCLAWLTRNGPLLELLSQGVDIYEAHARASMGYSDPRPLKEVDPEMRALAKVRCLSGDTLVLTDSGYKPITDVSLDDMVWDGVAWVHHDGIIETGSSETVPLFGDRYTFDHAIFVGEDETEPAGSVWGASSRLERDRCSLSDWDEVRFLAFALARACAEGSVRILRACAVQVRKMWERFRRSAAEFGAWFDAPMPPVPPKASVGETESGKMGEAVG